MAKFSSLQIAISEENDQFNVVRYFVEIPYIVEGLFVVPKSNLYHIHLKNPRVKPMSMMDDKKSFKTLTPAANVIKLFMDVSYNFS
jgi:hypothetical protein